MALVEQVTVFDKEEAPHHKPGNAGEVAVRPLGELTIGASARMSALTPTIKETQMSANPRNTAAAPSR